jgi:hypothetical protein
MKLTDLFWRARRRAPYPNEVDASARLGNGRGAGLGNDIGSGLADRSSMADLVRLLQEADEAQRGDGRQPA